jgi:LPS-assembly lipoprotein
MNYYKFLILILLSLSLAACGFHLRGATPMAGELNLVYIDSDQPYAPFEQALRAYLESSNIQIVDSPSPQAATIQIIDRSLTTSLITTSTNTLLIQYVLTYAVTYRVLDRYQNIIIVPNTIRSSNTYSSNNTQMLGSANQQDLLVDSLRNNTVFLLITRLNSKEARLAFKTGHPPNAH